MCIARAAALIVLFALAGCGGDPPEPVDSLVAVRAQQEAGEFEATLAPLRELLAEEPDNAEANFLYGRALVFTQQAYIAPWSLRKAMEDPEWLVPAGGHLAFGALAGRDFNEVVEITGRMLEQEPDNVQALLMRAQAEAHWKKDAELAIADAERVLELDPEKLEAYEPKILGLITLGRIEEAREALAEAGRRLEEVAAAESVLAWHCSTTAVFQQTGQEIDEARETWAKCLEAYPSSMEVVADAMAFYDEQGEPERSLELLRAALERAPESRTTRVALARRLRASGEAAEAEALLREATASDDPQVAAAAWMDLASHRQVLEDHAAATDALERAVELAREAGTPDPQLLMMYADALIFSGDLDRALEIAEELTVPAFPPLVRGRVAQERKNPVRALEEYGEALRLWPDNAVTRYYAAEAAEALGDFDRALEEYRYAVRIAAEATDARVRGAAILFAEGNAAAALEMVLSARAAPLEIEGSVLRIRIAGFLADMNAVSATLEQIDAQRPRWAGRALLAAAEGVDTRSGPAAAMSVLAAAPVDYGARRFAPALRGLVRFAYEADPPQETLSALRDTVVEKAAADPRFAGFEQIRALELELSGAPEEARAAYERSLELEGDPTEALLGLGRLASAEDPPAALALFDRAASASPSDPEPKLQAARALVAMGRLDDAASRLDALLLEHPLEGEAAALRARVDLERGAVTRQTVERAERAVRFMPGERADALDLLSEVHRGRGDPEAAATIAERARALRAARAAAQARDEESPEAPVEAGSGSG